jgi:branched-chain amino acid transport system ATP-binding protein
VRVLAPCGLEGALFVRADALAYFNHKHNDLTTPWPAPRTCFRSTNGWRQSTDQLEAGIAFLRCRLDNGPSIIMVEHVIHAIRSLCLLIVVLDAGRVIASGSPQQALGNRDVIPSLFW